MGTSARNSLSFIAKGFCMGAADIVPGVSGGTMAFILGIYQRFLSALKSFDLVWLLAVVKLQWRPALQRPDFALLLPLFFGIALALFCFTRIIPLPALLHTHPEPIYGLFFGLIVGSIVTLAPGAAPWNSRLVVLLGLGFGFGFGVVNLVPTDTPEASWFIFLSGTIAITAMMLPGISGSFILLMLRKYETVFGAVGRFDLGVLIPFGLGAAVGFILFSRLLSWLLERYYRAMLVFILGILTASLWEIWPFQVREYAIVREKERLIGTTPFWPDAWSTAVGQALLAIALGVIAVIALDYLARRQRAR